MNKEKGEIIICQLDDNVKLEVRLNEENEWCRYQPLVQ